MSQFIIQGPQKLEGEIRVSGAKNAVLKAIPAALLASGVTRLTNVPQIHDVRVMVDLISELGATVTVGDHELTIDPSTITSARIRSELSSKARTSILLVGPLLLKFGEVEIGHPGGCVIGRRPIDQFLDGFKALGVSIKDTGEGYRFSAKHLKGGTYFFPFVSVTATEALMMTAVLMDGTTVLKNAACEPEIAALGAYLNGCGAKISGAGGHTIIIEGVSELQAGNFEMIPDRIETGMFAILAAATRGTIRITNCNPSHVESLLSLFDRMGIAYNCDLDSLTVRGGNKPYQSPGKVITHEYPGFATDLQPLLTVLLTQTEGLTLVHETIFEGRLFYVDLLNRMGANIILCDPHRVLVQGPTELRGKTIESPDIRAGMAMVIAGLIAQGKTTIGNVYQIERGHENIEARLKVLGAKIERVN
ncbi:MAG: UDP-N-acetylglucosamine 1-carboxyvinyltransferase [bacterium]|nr:UDP-N-acetylglucosamine 1-carboxyvinyltransferase [bacterium]